MPDAEGRKSRRVGTRRVAITGAGGILGTALRACLPEGPDAMVAVGLTRADLDITRPEAVQGKLEEISPDAVIHAAAYTKVDAAEEEPDAARAVNAAGAAIVIAVAYGAGWFKTQPWRRRAG